MRVIAHRGFASILPENTRQAVREAAAMADAIEIDVRRCGSGELVVIHDATVDRVTDGTGPVATQSQDELAALDVLGTGEGIPTLTEVLADIPDAIGVNVELKEPGTAQDTLDVLVETDHQVVVSSFAPTILADCRDTTPAVPRALITAEPGIESIETANEIDCDYFHPAVEVTTEHVVNEAHRAGMSVNVWTVDSRSTAEEMVALGVDGLIADRWGVRPQHLA